MRVVATTKAPRKLSPEIKEGFDLTIMIRKTKMKEPKNWKKKADLSLSSFVSQGVSMDPSLFTPTGHKGTSHARGIDLSSTSKF